MIKLQRLKEIDAARGIGIILVVLGHCFQSVSRTILAADPYSRTIDNFIYSFHMPLMFFISGMLSTKVLTLEKVGRCNYIKSRFMRLMVPYFCVELLYIPFKLILSKFVKDPYDFSMLPLIFVGKTTNVVLWYLYSLFVMQIFVSLFANEKNLTFMIFISAVIFSSFNAIKLDFGSISRAFSQIQFFILGLWFSLNYQKNSTPPPCVNYLLFLSHS